MLRKFEQRSRRVAIFVIQDFLLLVVFHTIRNSLQKPTTNKDYVVQEFPYN